MCERRCKICPYNPANVGRVIDTSTSHLPTSCPDYKGKYCPGGTDRTQQIALLQDKEAARINAEARLKVLGRG